MYLPCAIVIAGEEALAPPIKDVVLVPRGQYARSQAVVEQDLQVWCRRAFAFAKNARFADKIVYVFSRYLTPSTCPALLDHTSYTQMAQTVVSIM